jgi:serine/threonine protein kinase
MTPELPRLPERFALGNLIGQGAVGRVFSATDTWTGETVAIKVLGDMPAGPHRGAWERTVDAELRSAARLTHPRLVGPQDVGMTHDGHPFFVMPFIHGRPLDSLIAEPLTWPQLADVLDQILDALSFAHARGVLHRDIKPQNILLRSHLETHDAFIVDLGLAYLRERYEEQSILKTEARGTPRYMAPEQLEGHTKDFGPWTDLYAVGIMLYEILSGEPPFKGLPMKVALAKVSGDAPPLVLRAGYSAPKAIEEVISALLARDTRRRFALAADVRAALRSLHRPLLPSGKGPPRPRAIEPPIMPPPDPTAPRPSIVISAKREPPMVGREELRKHLWSAARQVRQTGAPLAVLIEGDAGLGKTRLCQWLLEALEREGAMRHMQVRSSGGTTAHHLGLAGAVRRHLRCANLEGEALREQINSVMQTSALPNPEEEAALYRWLSSREFGGGLSLVERASLIRELLLLEAWRGGAALWIDDVAWSAPGEGLQLMEELLNAHERGDEAPLLLLASARPETYAERPREAECRERLSLRPDVLFLQVPPLNQEERLQLIDEIAPLEHDLALRIADHSQGSPLYTTHLLSYWVRENLLEEVNTAEGAQTRLHPSFQWEEALPKDMAALGEARIRSTIRRAIDPRATRLALWGAASLGFEFPVSSLERALSSMLGDEDRAKGALSAAWEGGLIRGGRRYTWARFDHTDIWAQLRHSASASHEGRTLAEACYEAQGDTQTGIAATMEDFGQ